MQRTFARTLGIVGVVLILVSISVLSVALNARARQNSPYVLTGQIVPLVSRAHLVGPANAQQQLNLSVGLQLRNQQELQTLLSDQSNPQSPRYHQFLSPQQFVDQFGPTADQQQQVIDFLRQQGLHPHPGRAPPGLRSDGRGALGSSSVLCAWPGARRSVPSRRANKRRGPAGGPGSGNRDDSA